MSINILDMLSGLIIIGITFVSSVISIHYLRYGKTVKGKLLNYRLNIQPPYKEDITFNWWKEINYKRVLPILPLWFLILLLYIIGAILISVSCVLVITRGYTTSNTINGLVFIDITESLSKGIFYSSLIIWIIIIVSITSWGYFLFACHRIYFATISITITFFCSLTVTILFWLIWFVPGILSLLYTLIICYIFIMNVFIYLNIYNKVSQEESDFSTLIQT